MKKVFEDTTLSPTRKLIMLSMADNANDTGVCFPSLTSTQDKTGFSRQTVNDNIKWLVENGYLFKKNRSRKKGGRSSNKYLLYPTDNRDLLDEDDYLIFEDLYTQSQTDGLGIQSQTDGLGLDTQSQTDGLESEPSLKSLTITEEKNIKKEKPKSLPRNLNLEAFEMWCEYKGKSYKQQGKTLSANMLSKYPQDKQMQMVESSIMNNYKGLFEIKETPKSSQAGTYDAVDAYFDAQHTDAVDVEVLG